MPGFYMKRNTGLKWIKDKIERPCSTNIPICVNALRYSAAIANHVMNLAT